MHTPIATAYSDMRPVRLTLHTLNPPCVATDSRDVRSLYLWTDVGGLISRRIASRRIAPCLGLASSIP